MSINNNFSWESFSVDYGVYLVLCLSEDSHSLESRTKPKISRREFWQDVWLMEKTRLSIGTQVKMIYLVYQVYTYYYMYLYVLYIYTVYSIY